MTPSRKRSRSASKSMWPGALRRADCCAQRDQRRAADLHDEVLAFGERHAVLHLEQHVLFFPLLLGRKQVRRRQRRAPAVPDLPEAFRLRRDEIKPHLILLLYSRTNRYTRLFGSGLG